MILSQSFSSFFFFNDTATTEIYTLSLHDALPISGLIGPREMENIAQGKQQNYLAHGSIDVLRSEEHTSELQSRRDLVCRLLLEKKKKKIKQIKNVNIKNERDSII